MERDHRALRDPKLSEAYAGCKVSAMTLVVRASYGRVAARWCLPKIGSESWRSQLRELTARSRRDEFVLTNTAAAAFSKIELAACKTLEN